MLINYTSPTLPLITDPTTMTSALSAVIHKTGKPDVFSIEKTSLPAPTSDQVLIKHSAIGVNFIDTYYRTGLYPTELPAIIGGEAVGIIIQIGANVDEFSVGQRVAYAAAKGGAYSEFSNIDACELVLVPDALDDQTVASSLLRGMSVEYLLCRLYPLKKGETVLIHAAAGGVGLIACQWAKAIGATVIGTVSSPEKAAIARQFGCDHPIIYTEEDFAEKVIQITDGQKVDVVYDGIGKTTFAKSLDCLKPRGLMVSFGNASGKPEPLDILELTQKGSLFLTRPTLYHYTRDRQELIESATRYFDMLIKGLVVPAPVETFSLQQAADSHRYLSQRDRTKTPILLP